MQQEDTPPILAYSPPEPRRRVPPGRLAITAVAFSLAHFITFAVTLSLAVGDDPWGAKGWSASDRIVDVLSYPLLHLALRFSADPDSVGWDWALLNSATWGAALSIAFAAALTIRRRLLPHNPPMHQFARRARSAQLNETLKEGGTEMP